MKNFRFRDVIAFQYLCRNTILFEIDFYVVYEESDIDVWRLWLTAPRLCFQIFAKFFFINKHFFPHIVLTNDVDHLLLAKFGQRPTLIKLLHMPSVNNKQLLKEY